MTDHIETVIAEAFKDAEVDCTWTPEGHATHVLASLKAARIAVVELPEPTYGPDGEGQYAWKSGAPSNITATPDEYGCWSVWDEDCQMTPDEARDTAAALLAAADCAEKGA